jgi:hypothetical protein
MTAVPTTTPRRRDVLCVREPAVHGVSNALGLQEVVGEGVTWP